MTDSPPPTSEHRVIALLLSLAAVAALGYASVSRQWLYNSRTVGTAQEVSFGPRGVALCNMRKSSDGACLELSNGMLVDNWRKDLDDARKAAAENPADEDAVAVAALLEKTLHSSAAFPVFGWIAMVACLLGALSLAIGVILIAAKKRIAWPIMPTTTALLSLIVGLVAGPVFVALKPGAPGFVGVSIGFFAFGGGVVIGIGAAIMQNKLMRPHDPDLLEGAMDPDQFV